MAAQNDFSKMLVLSSVARHPNRDYEGPILLFHGYYHLLFQLIVKGHADYVESLLFDKGILRHLLGYVDEVTRFSMLVAARASGSDVETFLRPEVFDDLPTALKYSLYEIVKWRGHGNSLKNTVGRTTKSLFRSVTKVAFETLTGENFFNFEAIPGMFSMLKHDLPHIQRFQAHL